MKTGEKIVAVGVAATDDGGPEKIDFDFEFIIENALQNAAYITETEQCPRKERIQYDSSIRNRYRKRPDHAADCLSALRNYAYLDPTRALIMKLPRLFGSDEAVTADVARRMREYGLLEGTIASICQQNLAVVEEGRYLYELNVDALKPEERTEEKLAELRAALLEFPWNPFVRFATNEEDETPLCVSVDSLGEGVVYYALSTSVPLHLGDKDLIRAYLHNCVLYMLGKMESQCNIKAIDTGTCIYFDFLEGTLGTLYIFLQLQRYDD